MLTHHHLFFSFSVFTTLCVGCWVNTRLRAMRDFVCVHTYIHTYTHTYTHTDNQMALRRVSVRRSGSTTPSHAQRTPLRAPSPRRAGRSWDPCRSWPWTRAYSTPCSLTFGISGPCARRPTQAAPPRPLERENTRIKNVCSRSLFMSFFARSPQKHTTDARPCYVFPCHFFTIFFQSPFVRVPRSPSASVRAKQCDTAGTYKCPRHLPYVYRPSFCTSPTWCAFVGMAGKGKQRTPRRKKRRGTGGSRCGSFSGEIDATY